MVIGTTRWSPAPGSSRWSRRRTTSSSSRRSPGVAARTSGSPARSPRAIAGRSTGRLPAAGIGTYGALASILLVDAVVALALGLLASAAVTDPSQATLALPMLCFPAVLFSGAVLPVPVMASAGSAISAATPARWAFEAVGRQLDLTALLGRDPSGQGQHLLAGYQGTFAGPVTGHVLVLFGLGAMFLIAAHRVITARTTPPGRRVASAAAARPAPAR